MSTRTAKRKNTYKTTCHDKQREWFLLNPLESGD